MPTPTLVRIGGREIAVETTPLKARSTSFRSATLALVRPDCLLLRPSFLHRLVVTGFLVFGIAFLITPFNQRVDDKENNLKWIKLPIGAGLWAYGGWMLVKARRHRFDREGGQWIVSSLLNSNSRPLSDIVAVQLLDGGWHSDGEYPDYRTRQLNLVLNDVATPRFCLSNHSNRHATYRDAKRLAEFLGVPLMDHL